MAKWIASAFDLGLTLFVKAPLLLIVALPAFCIGYAWCIAAGAFLWGLESHTDDLRRIARKFFTQGRATQEPGR